MLFSVEMIFQESATNVRRIDKGKREADLDRFDALHQDAVKHGRDSL